MGLGILILGLVVFLGAHVFVSFREERARAIAQLGLPAYRGPFVLASLAGLALIVWGYGEYRALGWIDIWSPPAFMRHITVGLMLFAVIFLVAAFVPESHQGAAQASDAGKRKDLGLGASAFEWRPRLDPTVRYIFGLGCLYAYRRKTPHRYQTDSGACRLDQ